MGVAVGRPRRTTALRGPIVSDLWFTVSYPQPPRLVHRPICQRIGSVVHSRSRMRKGIPVSPGVAVGTAFCIHEIFVNPDTKRLEAHEVTTELSNFEAAREKA